MENQIVCANCNSANSTKNLFCQNCGKPLTAARPASPVKPVQPVSPISEPPAVPPTSVPIPPSFQPVASPPPMVTPQVSSIPPAYPQTPSAPIQAAQSETSSAVQPPQVPPSQPTSVYPPKVAQPMTEVAKPFPIPSTSVSANINQLGISSDSWAAIIENGAEKGAAVSEEFGRMMEERRIPDVMVTRKEMTADGESNGRTFHLLKNSKGGTIAVYFGAQGKDLLISWDVYIKPQINLLYLAILLGGTAALTLVITLITGILDVSFISFLFSWVNRFYAWLFPVIVMAVLAGLILKGDWLSFFIKRPNKFGQDDLTGLMLIGHQVLLKAVEAAGLDVGKFRIKRGLRTGSWFRKI